MIRGPVNFIQTPLPGVILIEPKVFADDRGFFMETYQAERFAENGSLGSIGGAIFNWRGIAQAGSCWFFSINAKACGVKEATK